MKKVNMQFAFCRLLLGVSLLAGLMSCKGEDTWTPLPPFPPVPAPEMVSVDFSVRLPENTETDSSVLFVSKWNEEHCILGYSLKTKEALNTTPKSSAIARTRTSPIDPRRLFRLIDGMGMEDASAEGRIIKGDDSLVVIRTSRYLLRINYVKRQYETDSLPDVFRYDDLMIGSAKVDTVNGTTISMKHITSVLDTKLINKTGLDLQIRKVTVRPADVNCWPFHTSVDESLYYGRVDAGSANTLLAEYSKGSVANGATFTVRHLLFPVNESVLDGKALIYSVTTNYGVFSYTKVGKKYKGGKHYVEEIVMEGQ